MSKVTTYLEHQDQVSGLRSGSADLHAWALTWSGEQAWQVHGTGGGSLGHVFLTETNACEDGDIGLVVLFPSVFWGGDCCEQQTIELCLFSNAYVKLIQTWTDCTLKHIVFTQLCTQNCRTPRRLGFYSGVLGYNLVPYNSHSKSEV